MLKTFGFWMIVNMIIVWVSPTPTIAGLALANQLFCILMSRIDRRKTNEKEELIKHGESRADNKK